MSLDLSRKEKLILIATVLVIILIFVATFFFLIQPKKTELANQENFLQSEQQLLATIQSQLTSASDDAFASSVQLQKTVPVKPLLEKLILDIEKAEIVSNSLVTDVTFGEGVAVEIPDDEEEETTDEETSEDEQVEGEESEKENEEIEEEEEKIPLPEGVEKIVMNVEVETKSYESLEKFIETIENSERIIVVENIDFSGSEEVTSMDHEEEPLSFSLTISAFYMPILTDLIEQLPQIEAPAPSKKKNPFIQFTDVKK